jgi:hypothetical protein
MIVENDGDTYIPAPWILPLGALGWTRKPLSTILFNILSGSGLLKIQW